MRLLDLFCGRWGWSRAFAERGWECVGVDLVEPPEIPDGCQFAKADVLEIIAENGEFALDCGTRDCPDWVSMGYFDFICASPPCEQFSVHGMKHFHPNPPYPELGIKLFNNARSLCEVSGVPYVMENVRAAQQFVGDAINHCGPFYLWGNAVPPLMPGNIRKGIDWGSSKDINTFTTQEQKRAYRDKPHFYNRAFSTSAKRRDDVAKAATIPPELSACVADYAMRLLEVPA